MFSDPTPNPKNSPIGPQKAQNDPKKQGFHFSFWRGGGMVPPLRGGTQGGDSGS